MQNFFTREDVLAYHQQGVQTIRLDSMPILTDLARETLQTLGMEIVTGAAPAAQPASRPAASRPAAAPSGGSSAVGGGYGSSAFAAPSALAAFATSAFGGGFNGSRKESLIFQKSCNFLFTSRLFFAFLLLAVGVHRSVLV